MIKITLKKRSASLYQYLHRVCFFALPRCGFTLIELIISLAIAAILGAVLTMLLNRSYTVQQRFDALTHVHSRAALFFTQLERDIMGATVPIENILAINDSQKKKDNKQNNKETETQEQEKTNIAENQTTKKTDEQPYKAVEKVFYCMQKQHTLLLSWISRDPLQLYWGSSVGQARPRIARIMYRLEPEPIDKTLFRLVRNEGSDLTYAPYEKQTDQKYKGNVLIDGIRSLSITCISIQEKKDETKKKEQELSTKKTETQSVFEVKKMDTWEWPRVSKETSAKKEESSQDETPPLPHGLHVRLVLWNAATEKEAVFECAIAIPSVPNLKQKQPTQQTEKEQEAEKPSQQSTTKTNQGKPENITPRAPTTRPSFNPSSFMGMHTVDSAPKNGMWGHPTTNSLFGFKPGTKI